MNLTYLGRINPELSRAVLFEEDELKLLYCLANRTKKAPKKAYSVKEAVDYVGWIGGLKRAPSTARRESKSFGQARKSFTPCLSTAICSILRVKFSLQVEVVDYSGQGL